MSFGDRVSTKKSQTVPVKVAPKKANPDWEFPVQHRKAPKPMTTEIAPQQHPVQLTNPVVDVQAWTQDRLDVLKRMFCKDLTNDEFSVFVEVVKRTGLNPFARQIYAVKRNGKMTIQTGIDGFRLTADRTGKYAGSDDYLVDDEKDPNRATVTVYKLVGGVRSPFTATARWSEYYPGDAQGFMWKKMPVLMLGKCAESLALRKAFPAELSGIYSKEEMEQSERGSVHPEQPGPDDGHQPDPRTLGKFTRGSFARKAPSEIDLNELRKWLAGLDKRLSNPKSPLTPDEREEWEWNYQLGTDYVTEFETNEAVDFGEGPGSEG